MGDENLSAFHGREIDVGSAEGEPRVRSGGEYRDLTEGHVAIGNDEAQTGRIPRPPEASNIA